MFCLSLIILRLEEFLSHHSRSDLQIESHPLTPPQIFPPAASLLLLSSQPPVEIALLRGPQLNACIDAVHCFGQRTC